MTSATPDPGLPSQLPDLAAQRLVGYQNILLGDRGTCVSWPNYRPT